MGEADDLLKAAIEAQHLGRLKMASNYLILLHSKYRAFLLLSCLPLCVSLSLHTKKNTSVPNISR